jgi:hypothetical protein
VSENQEKVRGAIETLRMLCNLEASCEECGAPGTRYFTTEGDGPYWLCDSTDANHAMPERYAAESSMRLDWVAALSALAPTVEGAGVEQKQCGFRAHVGNCAICERLAEVRAKIASYDGGDRPPSPPAKLLAEERALSEQLYVAAATPSPQPEPAAPSGEPCNGLGGQPHPRRQCCVEAELAAANAELAKVREERDEALVGVTEWAKKWDAAEKRAEEAEAKVAALTDWRCIDEDAKTLGECRANTSDLEEMCVACAAHELSERLGDGMAAAEEQRDALADAERRIAEAVAYLERCADRSAREALRILTPPSVSGGAEGEVRP